MKRRYKLRDPEIFRYVMDHPGRGVPYTTRSLAAAIGKHHSYIGHLLTGERAAVEVDIAHSIAEATGVAVLVLFEPPTSPNQNDPAPAPDPLTTKEST